MTLFKRTTTLLTWQEPPLFAARMRDRRGWILRGLLALVIFAAMMAGFYADKHWGGRGPKFSTPGAVLLSAFIGVFLTSILDAPDLNREITISDDNINAFSNIGTHMSMSTWALRDVLWVRLIPPEEFGRSFGAMEFQTRRQWVRIGVPASLSMRRIAEVLHSQGIRVTLAGWQPSQAEPTTAAGDGNATTAPAPAAMPAPTAMPVVSARVEPLDEGEAGQILTPFRLGLGLTMALGPLVVAVIVGLGLCGYTIYRVKIVGGPATMTVAAAGLGGMGLIFAAVWLTSRFGNLVPALYLRAAARSVISMRPRAVLDPRDPEAIYVDVIPRANWGKAMIRNATDTGLLAVDEFSRCVLFEGDQQRWKIPAASLISAEVESYRPAGHVEGRDGENFYVTVIRARVGGDVWEAPVSKCHVELRPKNNRLRETNALALRDRIRALMPTGLGPGQGAQPAVRA